MDSYLLQQVKEQGIVNIINENVSMMNHLERTKDLRDEIKKIRCKILDLSNEHPIDISYNLIRIKSFIMFESKTYKKVFMYGYSQMNYLHPTMFMGSDNPHNSRYDFTCSFDSVYQRKDNLEDAWRYTHYCFEPSGKNHYFTERRRLELTRDYIIYFKATDFEVKRNLNQLHDFINANHNDTTTTFPELF